MKVHFYLHISGLVNMEVLVLDVGPVVELPIVDVSPSGLINMEVLVLDVTPVVELSIVDVSPDIYVKVTPPELPVLYRLVTTRKKNTIMRFDLDKDDDLAFVHTTSRHLLHYIPPTPEIYGSWSF